MRSKLRNLLVILLLWPAAAHAAEQHWLLVTTPELRASFEPLVELRREEGYEVSVYDTWRAPSESPSDSTERILSEIQRVRDAADSVVIVIGGAYNQADTASYVPTCAGQKGRMKKKRTDYYYSLPNEQELPTVMVGRLPAANRQQAEAMVGKLIQRARSDNETAEKDVPASPDAVPSESAPHLGIIVAHPGGRTQLEKRFAEAFLRMTVEDRLKLFDPEVQINVIADMQNSKFAKPDQDFGELARQLLADGNMFTVYCGHSSAQGLWSKKGYVVTRDQFATMKSKGSPGVLLSCGCFTCQVGLDKGTPVQVLGGDGKTKPLPFDTHGFGIAGIRNAGGPIAVIGPFGESYAIFGKLALDGLQEQFREHDAETRLGDYWLAVQRNLQNGKVDPFTFYLFDQADGSRGKTSFADQREEHVEMWTLLGDPAMVLGPITATSNSADGDE